MIQALRLLQGNEGVLPALRAAAEQYHYTQAPIDDLSRLLSQVTLAAEAQEVGNWARWQYGECEVCMMCPIVSASVWLLTHDWLDAMHCNNQNGRLL